MSEQEQFDWQKFGEAVATWANAVSKQLQETFQQIIPILQTISDAVWESYRAAGMPYGDTQEGLMQWIEDMGEAKRHQQEIERIIQRHEMLVSARALGEKIREKRAREEGAQ